MNNTENLVVTTGLAGVTDTVVVRTVDSLGRGYGTGRAKNDAVARVWISFSKSVNINTVTKGKLKKNKDTDLTDVNSTSDLIPAYIATANVKVNEQDMKVYFKRESLLAMALKPIHSLINLPLHTSFDIECTVSGSGLASQARALSLGIARGLIVLNPEFKEALRAAGLLTRGPIGKEREKYGQRGARADLPYKRR